MKRLLLFLGLTLLLAACQSNPASQNSQANPGYQNVSPQEAKVLIEKGEVFLLDVHVPNQGYLSGTDARVPYTEVAARASQLPTDKNTRILVYCMSGRMSAIAAPELVRLGYRNVINLEGGMVAWKDAGYEVLPE